MALKKAGQWRSVRRCPLAARGTRVAYRWPRSSRAPPTPLKWARRRATPRYVRSCRRTHAVLAAACAPAAQCRSAHAPGFTCSDAFPLRAAWDCACTYRTLAFLLLGTFEVFTVMRADVFFVSLAVFRRGARTQQMGIPREPGAHANVKVSMSHGTAVASSLW